MIFRSLALIGLLAALPSTARSLELPSPWELIGLQEPPRGFADELPVCVPEANRPEVETAARVAREGDLARARTLLPRRGRFTEERSEAAVRLFRAILDARSGHRREAHALRSELARATVEFDAPQARVCGWSERARLALRIGLAGEALGDLALAERSLPDDAPALTERVAFYRAEALWMAGQRDAALDAYRLLIGASEPSVVWVARTQVEASGGASWADLRASFQRGAGLGVDMDPWSMLAGELAYRAQRFGDALHWFSRAEGNSSEDDEFASLRRADALLLEGRDELGRRVLERLERRSTRPVVRAMAAFRLAQAGVGDEARSIERFEFASRSETPGVATRALQSLVRSHLEAEQPDGALEAIARLRMLAPRGGVPGLDELVDEVVELATATSDDCVTLLGRLAGNRDSWIGSIRSPDPLLRLGDCARELHLTPTAADVYRALSRRFPNRISGDLAVRIADASWELGERSIVESLMAANARTERTTAASFSQRAPWLRLRADIALADGRAGDALKLLRELAESSETPAAERERVASRLVRLPIESESAAEVGRALEAALRWDRDLPPLAMGLAWLRLADLRRVGGRPEAARRAYRRAAELIPPDDDAHGRSLHALSATADSPEQRASLLEQLAAEAPGGPWNELAQGELRLAHLRHLIDQSDANSR